MGKERSQRNECVLRRPCDDPTNSNNSGSLYDEPFGYPEIVFADWDVLKLMTVYSRLLVGSSFVVSGSPSHTAYSGAEAFCCVVGPSPSSRQNLLCNFSFWSKAGKRPSRLQSH